MTGTTSIIMLMKSRKESMYRLFLILIFILSHKDSLSSGKKQTVLLKKQKDKQITTCLFRRERQKRLFFLSSFVFGALGVFTSGFSFAIGFFFASVRCFLISFFFATCFFFLFTACFTVFLVTLLFFDFFLFHVLSLGSSTGHTHCCNKSSTEN